MRRSRLWLLATITVVAAIAVVGSLVTPAGRVARAAHGSLAPVLATQLVCPTVTGGGSAGQSTDMVVANVGAGPAPRTTYSLVSPSARSRAPIPLALRPSALVRKGSSYGAVLVNASGPGAGGVVATQASLIPNGLGRGLLDVACRPPATDWWFAGADGGVRVEDRLWLVNAADTPANVAISFWSGRGPLSPPNTTGIVVAAHSALVRKLSDYAPDVPQVAFHVHANSGTVAVGVTDLRNLGDRPTGSDFLPPTLAPTRSSIVTGFMPGATYGLVDIVNPSNHDATVSLRVVTSTKDFAPAGHQSVVVRAGHTVRVDLSAIIATEVAAVAVDSDTPVTAAALTATRPTSGFTELAWLPAQAPLAGPAAIADNVPPFGQKVSLIVTAPATSARLRVANATGSSATVSVPAGRTRNVDLRALFHAGATGPGPIVLTPLSGAVYVIRTLYAVGAHGPLMAASTPMLLPAATELPAVVDDPRAALP